MRVSLFRFRPYENLQTLSGKMYDRVKAISFHQHVYIKTMANHDITQSLNLLISIISDSIHLSVLETEKAVGMNGL